MSIWKIVGNILKSMLVLFVFVVGPWLGPLDFKMEGQGIFYLVSSFINFLVEHPTLFIIFKIMGSLGGISALLHIWGIIESD